MINRNGPILIFWNYYRYGKRRGLTFALPAAGNRLGVPAKFNAKFIDEKSRSKNNKYDFYVLHSRLNIPEVKKVIVLYPIFKYFWCIFWGL